MIRNVKHTNLNSQSVVKGFKTIFNSRVEEQRRSRPIRKINNNERK